MKLYRKAHYAPRAFVVHHVEVQPDEARALEHLDRPPMTPWHVTQGEVSAQPPGRAEPPSRTTMPAPGDLQIEAAPAADGLLVVSEVYGRGWQARVDGRPVPVLNANVLLCGVPLTAGQPLLISGTAPGPVIGALLSGLALLALVAFSPSAWAEGRSACPNQPPRLNNGEPERISPRPPILGNVEGREACCTPVCVLLLLELHCRSGVGICPPSG